jgi:penicillin-binding protein 1A
VGFTLRDALEDSRNVPTVRLMAALGPREVVNYAKRLGVTSPLPEYLSVAIGAAEGSLIEMTAAYASFANQGVRMTPIPILEVVGRDGTILGQHRAEAHEAIRADTAYITTSMLEGVIQHGTGQAAKVLDWPLAGKTGTTDDYSDAWFIGFDPNITVGVWLGFDQKKPIGTNQTGAVAALPIWQEIMKSWIARQRPAHAEPPVFERPGNIVTVSTSRGPEVFIAGTQPQ